MLRRLQEALCGARGCMVVMQVTAELASARPCGASWPASADAMVARQYSWSAVQRRCVMSPDSSRCMRGEVPLELHGACIGPRKNLSLYVCAKSSRTISAGRREPSMTAVEIVAAANGWSISWGGSARATKAQSYRIEFSSSVAGNCCVTIQVPMTHAHQ